MIDKSLIEIQDENRRSWKIECNSCHEEKWMCKWIRNKRTGRCAILDEEYFPETGQIAKKHNCMFKGQGYWINKYDGSQEWVEGKGYWMTPDGDIEWAKGVTPDVNKVSEEDRAIAVKHWKETKGYQRLDKWELEQVERGRELAKTYRVGWKSENRQE